MKLKSSEDYKNIVIRPIQKGATIDTKKDGKTALQLLKIII